MGIAWLEREVASSQEVQEREGSTIDKEEPATVVEEEETGAEKKIADSQRNATEKYKDLVEKIMALTKALHGLPTSTIDADVKQLLEERRL